MYQVTKESKIYLLAENWIQERQLISQQKIKFESGLENLSLLDLYKYIFRFDKYYE